MEDNVGSDHAIEVLTNIITGLKEGRFMVGKMNSEESQEFASGGKIMVLRTHVFNLKYMEVQNA